MNSRVHLHVTIDRSTDSRAADVGSFFMGFAEMKKIRIKNKNVLYPLISLNTGLVDLSLDTKMQSTISGPKCITSFK